VMRALFFFVVGASIGSFLNIQHSNRRNLDPARRQFR
jgi:hypothetical protein